MLPRTEEFVVRGSFPGLRDGMAVALRNMEGEGTFAVDTVRDGKFELRGAVVSPRYCNLLIYTGEQNAFFRNGENGQYLSVS